MSLQVQQPIDTTCERLRRIEERLRRLNPTGIPVDVPFHPWGKIGWAERQGVWRIVVFDADDIIRVDVDLLEMPRQCREDACLVLPTLVERMGL